jgi:sugar lactone lactonase YvrE
LKEFYLRLLRQSAVLGVLFSACAFGQSNISTVAGFQALGAGFAGDNGPAGAAQMDTPSGIAADGNGNIYIADYNNFVVRIVSAGVIATFAGTGTTSGFSGDTGLAINARLGGPVGLAVNAAGTILYIADAPNNVIRKVTSGTITTIAGLGPASGGFSGDGGNATAAALNYPTGVALDSAGNLYIADSGNHRIRQISTSGTISTIAGTTTFGFNGDNLPANSTSLYLPKSVAVDAQGNVYIADTGNQRIRKITAGVITTIAGNGNTGYTGDKGPAASALINNPQGIAADANGNIYIADTNNNVIRKIAGGTISTVVGTGLTGYGGDGGTAISALLNHPAAVTLDPTGGNTYIADTQNNVIRQTTNTIVTGVIPHFAAGGNYVTGFYLINKGTAAANFTLNFNADNGVAVAVPIAGGAANTSITGSVPGLGTAYYEIGTSSAPNAISGSVSILANPSLVVQALIRRQSSIDSNVFYEATVPSSAGAFEVEIGFDDTTFATTSAQIYTGIGIANLDTVATASVTCIAKDNNGAVISGAVPPLTLVPLGHGAGYQFPALYGKRGTLDCISNTRMGVIALRFLGSEAISTLPTITIR